MTTDHISPAGAIKPDSPAGRYLVEHGVERKHFNSYGSRRGNHEVMVRGTFANVRLRNLLVPGSEGTWTVHVPSGDETTIFEAAERYREEGTPLIVLAGKEYGSGSSRDWAAKGPKLLGVRAVIAESYERIHRSNLLMMGVLPLQFRPARVATHSVSRAGRSSRSSASRTARPTRSPYEPTTRSSVRSCVSTRRASASTSVTAGSSRTFFGGCSPARAGAAPAGGRAWTTVSDVVGRIPSVNVIVVWGFVGGGMVCGFVFCFWVVWLGGGGGGGGLCFCGVLFFFGGCGSWCGFSLGVSGGLVWGGEVCCWMGGY